MDTVRAAGEALAVLGLSWWIWRLSCCSGYRPHLGRSKTERAGSPLISKWTWHCAASLHKTC